VTIIKINGIEIGDFVRVDKEDKCFKGYAVDMRNTFYKEFKILVTDTLKGFPESFEWIEDGYISKIEGVSNNPTIKSSSNLLEILKKSSYGALGFITVYFLLLNNFGMGGLFGIILLGMWSILDVPKYSSCRCSRICVCK